MGLTEWRKGDNNFRKTVNLVGYASLMFAIGEVAKAEALYLEALTTSPHVEQHKGGVAEEDCWLCSLFVSECYINLGLIFLGTGRLEAAKLALDRGIKLAPWQASGHLNNGALLRTLKKYDDSIIAYRTALGLEPDNARGYEGLGTTYEEAGNKKDAAENYRKALALDPTSAFAKEFLSKFK